jgi:hypothetical protein
MPPLREAEASTSEALLPGEKRFKALFPRPVGYPIHKSCHNTYFNGISGVDSVSAKNVLNPF